MFTTTCVYLQFQVKIASWKKPTLKQQQMQQILSQFINQRVKEYEVIVMTSL